MNKDIFRLHPGAIRAAICCVAFLLGSCGGGSSTEALTQEALSGSTDGTTDQLIVKPSNAVLLGAYELRAAEFAASVSTETGLKLTPLRQSHDGAYVLALPSLMSVNEVAQAAAQLTRRADVEYAEPDLILQPTALPNDTSFTKMWNLREPSVAAGGINAVDAWDVSIGDPNLVIAVVDTGVLNHSDFGGRVLSGYDFISSAEMANDGNARDSNATDAGNWLTVSEAALLRKTARASSWHGTHVAGTIGATGNNSFGVSGVNWRSRILPVRVLGKGDAYSSDVADGIAWAAGVSVPGVPNNPTPARVINLSLGGSGVCGQNIQNAINNAVSRMAVVVVAAGNEGVNVSNSQPANCAGVISVAAVGSLGQRAAYSNYGMGVTIAAPGGDPGQDSGVLSLGDSGQTTAQNDSSLLSAYGTSMAAPHVSGVISLVLSVNPALSPAEVKSLLRLTAKSFPTGTGRDCSTVACGAGIIDAGAAVRAAASATAGIASGVPQSGIWWNPSENGRGYVIEVQDGKLSFGAYLYDDAGRPTWYLSSGLMQSATKYAGTLEAYSGGQALNGPYKAPNGRISLGQVSIEFQTQTSATLRWAGGTMPIERFRFGAASSTATKFAPLAGVWWNPAESGRGYSFDVQDGFFSMSAFMYDSAGNPAWYVAAGPLSATNTFTGSLIQYANGQTLTGAYKAPSVSNAAVGSVVVRFVDSSAAVMTLPNGQVINLEKFRLSAGPEVIISRNQILTARLVGIWSISYKIITTYTDYFLFNEVRESSITPGIYNVWGINQYDVLALGGWSPEIEHYTIFAPGPLFDDFYVFDMPTFESISGCYYLAYRNPTRLSNCYALGAAKLADIAPLDTSSRLSAPQEDDYTRSIRIERESAFVDNERAAPKSVSKSLSTQAPVLARKPGIDQLIRTIEDRRSQTR